MVTGSLWGNYFGENDVKLFHSSIDLQGVSATLYLWSLLGGLGKTLQTSFSLICKYLRVGHLDHNEARTSVKSMSQIYNVCMYLKTCLRYTSIYVIDILKNMSQSKIYLEHSDTPLSLWSDVSVLWTCDPLCASLLANRIGHVDPWYLIWDEDKGI